VLRKAVEEAGGDEVKNLGDGLMVSFASPVAALACAVAMQRSMAEGDLRIRVGVHAGEPVHEATTTSGLRSWWPSGSAIGPTVGRSWPPNCWPGSSGPGAGSSSSPAADSP
jgi:class 3 adenylate cyclase